MLVLLGGKGEEFDTFVNCLVNMLWRSLEWFPMVYCILAM